MANEVSNYVSELPEPARSQIADIYAQARTLVPEATEGISYAMPALLYKGKGLLAVMNTKKHIGIYPFGNVAEFAVAMADAGLTGTKGSIHVHAEQTLPAPLLNALVLRRKAQIDG
jgi:uncharacterized protein YdhG (YjbR/CyaY superfamily)